MKKLIIFGFDGTIADTSPGILHCFNTIAASMSYKPVCKEKLYGVIGFQLENGLRRLFDMNDDEIEYAVHNYSKLYSMKGKEMFMLYDGVEDTLRKLKQDGRMLAIATQNHDMYTRDMLKAHGMTELFDMICATDINTNLSKADMLKTVCGHLNTSVEDSLFVGDNNIDADGANVIGMDFAAVTYGWGFRSEEETRAYRCCACIENSKELYDKISKL